MWTFCLWYIANAYFWKPFFASCLSTFCIAIFQTVFLFFAFGLFLCGSPSFMVFFGIVKVLVPKISQINLKRLLKAFLHTLCTFRVEFFLGDASGALHPFLVSVFVRRKGKKNSLEFVCWQNDWNGKTPFSFRKLWLFSQKVICSLSNIYWIWKQFYLSKCILLHASNNNSNQKLCLIETHKYCFIAFKVNFDEVIKSDCIIKLFQSYTLFFPNWNSYLLFLFCSAFNGSIENCSF